MTNTRGKVVDLIPIAVGDRIEIIKDAMREVHDKAPANGYTMNLMRNVETKYNPTTSQVVVESDINSLIIVTSNIATNVNRDPQSRAVALEVLSLIFEQDVLAEYYYMYYGDLIKLMESRNAASLKV